MEPRAADQIGIERKETKEESENDCGDREHSHPALFQPFVPIIDCEQTKADKGERVPIRRRDVIQREQKIKSEHGQTEPEQKQDFELLIDSTPAADYRPHQKSKEQR